MRTGDIFRGINYHHGIVWTRSLLLISFHLQLKELWNQKVINPRTRCWAIGMDGWRSLQQLPQLKWCLMAKGTPLFNETELASHILDVLIKCTSFFPSRYGKIF